MQVIGLWAHVASARGARRRPESLSPWLAGGPRLVVLLSGLAAALLLAFGEVEHSAP